MSVPRPRISAIAIVGIVLVSIWMVGAGLFILLLGFGDMYVCESGTPCVARYGMWWLVVAGTALVSAILAIIFWTIPRRRPWGFVFGIVGTAGPPIALMLAYDVPF